MANAKLDALVKIGTLHLEPSDLDEIESLVTSGRVQLRRRPEGKRSLT